MMESDHTPEASTNIDAQGEDNLTQPKGSGEQPTSVEGKLRWLMVYGSEFAILDLIEEERRQAKIEILESLALWTNELMPSQIEQRLKYLRGENTSEL